MSARRAQGQARGIIVVGMTCPSGAQLKSATEVARRLRSWWGITSPPVATSTTSRATLSSYATTTTREKPRPRRATPSQNLVRVRVGMSASDREKQICADKKMAQSKTRRLRLAVAEEIGRSSSKSSDNGAGDSGVA
jgi:hypothetical protein